MRAARANGTALGISLSSPERNPETIALRHARQVLAVQRLGDRTLTFVPDALVAVLDAPDLQAAQAAARAGLDRIAAESPVGLLEVAPAAALAGVTRSTVRRWAARHRRGRAADWFAYRLGGRWVIERPRFLAFVMGATA